MLVFLAVMCALEIGAMAVLIGITIERLQDLPVVSAATGCSYSGLLPVSSLFWTPALVFEPILCFLVVAKTWKDLPKSIFWGYVPHLPAVLARDSLLYFFVVFANLVAATIIWAQYPHYINVINPYVPLHLPRVCTQTFVVWASAIPSLLGSRLLLNMRERMLQTDVITNRNLPIPMHDTQVSTLRARQTQTVQSVQYMEDGELLEEEMKFEPNRPDYGMGA
ncbi:hypothetical protein PLICRDRAFT_117526 [Plicaturopsis crispa FD-325 SS-3]|uniref:Unplaced genomic scaffold PLICRscaffold_17, whole genome shotgun sequence n=1 Tax=Plicaturopsis crispa FD-325 SS-3 TaxID=944288 RepID=A0A0C9SL01_PLICR|nr:hypothetical protein PLICRDRAFT_117526 [Plicaturopsis crispa FD-325 SS-3]